METHLVSHKVVRLPGSEKKKTKQKNHPTPRLSYCQLACRDGTFCVGGVTDDVGSPVCVRVSECGRGALEGSCGGGGVKRETGDVWSSRPCDSDITLYTIVQISSHG